MKKIFKFIECDTIFTGDYSKHGKIHTIENGVRLIFVMMLIIGSMKLNYWLVIPAIFGVGFTIRPEYMRPNYKIKLW